MSVSDVLIWYQVEKGRNKDDILVKGRDTAAAVSLLSQKHPWFMMAAWQQAWKEGKGNGKGMGEGILQFGQVDEGT